MLTCIGAVQFAYKYPHRCAVKYEMMYIHEQPILTVSLKDNDPVKFTLRIRERLHELVKLRFFIPYGYTD